MDSLRKHTEPKAHPQSLEDDVLLKKLLLSHNPAGHGLDSELLLHVVENIMFYASSLQVSDTVFTRRRNIDIANIQLVHSREALGYYTMKQILCKVLHEYFQEDNLQSRIVDLLDFLGSYRWDDKAVLLLAAFATKYGEFWQLMELCPHGPLALLVARLKRLPSDLRPLKPIFKALHRLVKTMMEIAMCITKFERLPLSDVVLDDRTVFITQTKSHIYAAVYWIARGILACFSQIRDFTTLTSTKYRGGLDGNQQVYSNSTITAVWELSSLEFRLSGLRQILKQQVDFCQEEMEKKIHVKLSQLFQEIHADNQEVLHMLFDLKDEFPLQDCYTQEKIGVSKFKDKLVTILISKPHLFMIEEVLLLVQQTSDLPSSKKLEVGHSIIWLPTSGSDAWTDEEESRFHFLSNALPWYSVCKPRLINSGVLRFVKQEWNYEGDPLLVVLGLDGKPTNLNAMDLVMVWGHRAFPFSASKEAELWQDQKLTVQLLIEDVCPRLAYLVEECTNICIYGSESLEWVHQFNVQIEELKKLGVKLEMVYVGHSSLSEGVKQIMARVANADQSVPLSLTKIKLFWLRLERMRKSKLRRCETCIPDRVLQDLTAILDTRDDKGWAIVGKGSSSTDIVRLRESDWSECFHKLMESKENITNLGLICAMKIATLDPTHLGCPCSHSFAVPFPEGLKWNEGSMICKRCKRPMRKSVKYLIYECNQCNLK